MTSRTEDLKFYITRDIKYCRDDETKQDPANALYCLSDPLYKLSELKADKMTAEDTENCDYQDDENVIHYVERFFQFKDGDITMCFKFDERYYRAADEERDGDPDYISVTYMKKTGKDVEKGDIFTVEFDDGNEITKMEGYDRIVDEIEKCFV